MADYTIAPQPMKSDDTLVEYIEYFERIGNANRWNDEQMALIFQGLLPLGSRILDSVTEAALKKFTTLKAAVVTSAEPFRESNCEKLFNIQLESEEPLNKFRDRIAKLIDMTYGRFAKANRLQLLRDIFVVKLPNDLKRFVVASKADKIDDALNSALLGQSNR